ncbi:F0F1 ATP synthase subunit gamma [Loigolactobacillus backii]|uniref:ATP synthase gamma chain n=1 Tax=Loigolactobacillus backii TaxID=375175 RepID=A0A192H4B0_9LACO|nr:F0F1 ATP synthase subunit gamma [Loigolactobacillus backii]ANK59872.1 F0F1 ATP synthase subunit gamma [Loigolactobacillus backii]ANK63210.1 F0F1 ATP synthase subunit gamma [Loigolactobacillus backii]ANK64805.1 F0F1 ATP synthase subunit gamma [Loigolactobacillus backii]ANK66747.1 F0F1 ATP synthase subunit gamma [Loigolactobacillus backii]ANK69784.1 F0F1 ATP synthase subunit gamma [Loigolactobacillus backii]
MAESLTEIKRRIDSTKSTEKITQAMQMVSASKLNQIEKKSSNYLLYSSKIREIVTHMAAAQLLAISNFNDKSSNKDGKDKIRVSSMLQERPVKKTGYLVITSDRGLVGSYNSNVIKAVTDMITKDHKNSDEYVFMAVGGTGADFFKNRGMNIAYEYRGVSDVPTFNEVREIVTTAVSMFDSGVFDELYVCYNHHVNTLRSEFRAEKMLPITDLDISEVKDKHVSYIADPSQEEVLDAILPQYAASLIFGALMDAKAAEHSAGMNAMRSATDNAKDLIDHLTLTYNRARQGAITQEITEIIAGASALE